MKIGAQPSRVRLRGHNFPSQVAPVDLDFGPGVTVPRIVSRSPNEIVAEVDVAADAKPGKRDVACRPSVLPGAMAIYDRIDYVKVTPDSTVAAFGDSTHPRGYQQFEARTADDLALGSVDVAWTIQVFHAADGSSWDAVGAMSPTGLFVPAAGAPVTTSTSG
jgi:quinohemoprotein amine dehydrogenase